eukprot:185377-Rhodomonas_salina.2
MQRLRASCVAQHTFATKQMVSVSVERRHYKQCHSDRPDLAVLDGTDGHTNLPVKRSPERRDERRSSRVWTRSSDPRSQPCSLRSRVVRTCSDTSVASSSRRMPR